MLIPILILILILMDMIVGIEEGSGRTHRHRIPECHRCSSDLRG